MEAKELRIGNLVYDTRTVGDRTGLPPVRNKTKITSIEEGSVYRYIEPIPLTPEILEKAGFVTSEELSYKTVYNLKGVEISLIKDKRILFDVDNGDFVFGFTKIKYIHQLQNLYFALTGEELEVNL